MFRKIINAVISQFYSPPIFNTNINNLPPNVILHIFNFLTYEDITNARYISKFVYDIAANYIRNAIFEFRLKLNEAIDNVYPLITQEGITFREKVNAIKLYNLYKVLESEMDIVCVLNRHILERKNLCLPIGSVLDLFYSIFNKVQDNPAKVTEIYQESNNSLYNDVKDFLENMENSDFNIIDAIPLGVQAMDQMDLLLDTDFKIVVTYKILENMCQIRGTYTVNKARLLNYLPPLPQNCANRQLTREESITIMKYLSILLQVHNRINIEEDFSIVHASVIPDLGRMGQSVKKITSIIPQKYINERHYANREIVDARKGIVRETYQFDNKNKDISSQGLLCKINLNCSLDNAPLVITKRYEQLKDEIEKQFGNVTQISPKIFSHQDKSEDCYGVLLYLKVWYSRKVNHVYPKDTVEFYFNDGKTVSA